ncbi:MAG TPA: metallophosphoesterase [Anaerolineales bacterium]|jgi:Icc-related predicted phosphoesterase|nr:metallophosphoesterase [Anaerolineales bacterium]
MKILAISDQVEERIYTLAAQGHFQDVRLILGCGDLPYTYLEYLVSVLNVPMMYVPGNHDPEYNPRSAMTHAEGGSNLDLKSVCVKDVLIAGFGGSIRYRPDGVNQYTQGEANFRAAQLMLGLMLNRARYGRALDILITHSPPLGIHDDDTQAHRGLNALNWILRWARPRYHFHGHTHFMRQNLAEWKTQLGPTTIMNVYPYKVIDYV